jgi:hypothetical protein
MSIFRLDFVTSSTVEHDHITEHHATLFATNKSDTKQARCEGIVFCIEMQKRENRIQKLRISNGSLSRDRWINVPHSSLPLLVRSYPFTEC